MLTTKRKPVTVGEILVEEFIRPMGLTQNALAEAMGVQRKHVNLTVETLGDRWSLIVIRDLMFGNRRHFRELLTGLKRG